MLGPVDPFPKELADTLRGILAQRVAQGEASSLRSLALLNTHISTFLRAGDLLSLRVGDVMEKNGDIRNAVYWKQKKTGEQVKCFLSAQAQDSLVEYIADRKLFQPNGYLFPGRTGGPLTVRRYQEIVKDWLALLCEAGYRTDLHLSTHSLRKAGPKHIYEASKDDYACMVLLGHKGIETTRRYLGITNEYAYAVAAQYPF